MSVKQFDDEHEREVTEDDVGFGQLTTHLKQKPVAESEPFASRGAGLKSKERVDTLEMIVPPVTSTLGFVAFRPAFIRAPNWLAGGQAGVNCQINQFVLGIEGDGQAVLGGNYNVNNLGFFGNNRNNVGFLGTARLRP